MKSKTISRLFLATTKKPEIFFLIAGFFFGLLFIVINPPFFGLDERAHFMRAYQIANWELEATRVGPSQDLGAELPVNLTQLVQVSTNDLIDSNPRASIFGRRDANSALYEPYYKQRLSGEKAIDPASNAQLIPTFSYSPLGYFHLGLAFKIAEAVGLSVLHIMYSVRFMSLLVYIGIIYFAVRAMPRHKWLLVTTALLPTALFQATIVSTDSLINAFAFLLFGLMISYWNKGDRSLLRNFYVLCSLMFLALMKPPYILIALPFLVVEGLKIARTKQLSYAWKVAWVGMPAGIVLAWNSLNRTTIDEVVGGVTTGNFNLQLTNILQNPFNFLAATFRTYYGNADNFAGSTIGWVGDRQVALPLIFIMLFFMLTVGLSALISEGSSKKVSSNALSKLKLSSLVLTVIGIVVGISLSLYLIFTPVGANSIGGIQGRYFLPIIPTAVLAVAPLNLVSISVSRKIVTIVMCISSTVFLGSTALLYYMANY